MRLAAALALVVACADDPRPKPVEDAVPAAAGPDEDANARLERAFAPAADFAPLPKPMPGDWLAEHAEPGQSFAAYVEGSPNLPTQGQDKIYVLPIGSLRGGPAIGELRDYTARFFGLEVAVLPAIEPDDTGARTRMNGGTRQLLAPSVMAYLQGKLPGDAYCLIGVTMVDLYPAEDWNFVFGQASLVNRVGVFSFARNDGAFYGSRATSKDLVRSRAMQIMTHEIGHMFGIKHCTDYACNMNGTNSLDEADRQPAHLCPVCLQKLHHASAFDPRARYKQLAEFYDTVGMTQDAAFARRRIARIDG